VPILHHYLGKDVPVWAEHEHKNAWNTLVGKKKEEVRDGEHQNVMIKATLHTHTQRMTPPCSSWKAWPFVLTGSLRAARTKGRRRIAKIDIYLIDGNMIVLINQKAMLNIEASDFISIPSELGKKRQCSQRSLHVFSMFSPSSGDRATAMFNFV